MPIVAGLTWRRNRRVAKRRSRAQQRPRTEEEPPRRLQPRIPGTPARDRLDRAHQTSSPVGDTIAKQGSSGPCGCRISRATPARGAERKVVPGACGRITRPIPPGTGGGSGFTALFVAGGCGGGGGGGGAGGCG
ncbi:MAG: hypothetical protein EXR72_05920 [Myxococcales bacterium]|nr:hypothetical protein [Myxococcales bacterium]